MSSVELSKYIANWQRIVSHIENGYGLTIYDYINDLDCRHLIQKLIDNELFDQSIIETIDQSYLDSTVLINKSLSTLTMWWYYRIPHYCYEELYTDLVDFGIEDDILNRIIVIGK